MVYTTAEELGEQTKQFTDMVDGLGNDIEKLQEVVSALDDEVNKAQPSISASEELLDRLDNILSNGVDDKIIELNNKIDRIKELQEEVNNQ